MQAGSAVGHHMNDNGRYHSQTAVEELGNARKTGFREAPEPDRSTIIWFYNSHCRHQDIFRINNVAKAFRRGYWNSIFKPILLNRSHSIVTSSIVSSAGGSFWLAFRK